MKFQSDKTSFGRHETFALRYGWLTKGIFAIKNNENNSSVFESDSATVDLGVGSNMVYSIKYWLRACQLTDAQGKITKLGDYIFDEDSGRDPYLEDEATLWLIHWLLASNAEQATAWYWFFNKFHKSEFTAQELNTALYDWVRANVDSKVAPATLQKDALMIPRMYSQSKGNTRTPLEEALDSPLGLLRLITQTSGGRSYQCKPKARPNLPAEVVGFAVYQLMQAKAAKSIPIEDLMYSRDDYAAPGAVFRLTENDLIAKLEKLSNNYPDVFAVRETAGIHQLYLLKEIKVEKMLANIYSASAQEVAA